MIVVRSLDADPTDDCVALELRASDRRGQDRQAGFGQRELEWRDDDLAIVIGDQRHRSNLAYVHRYGQTALRIHPRIRAMNRACTSPLTNVISCSLLSDVNRQCRGPRPSMHRRTGVAQPCR